MRKLDRLDAPLLALLTLAVALVAAAPRRPRRTGAATRPSRSSPTRSRRTSTRSSSPPTRRPRQAQGVKFTSVLRRLRGAEQGGRRRPARRRRQLLHLHRHGPARPGRAVDKSWARTPPRDRLQVRRRLRAAQRQPEAHQTWDDLVKPGVQVVFPNPFSSGGARWDIMAAYGARAPRGQDAEAGAGVPRRSSSSNNVSQDTSGRNALNTFLSGKGDVLLDYESDAKLAQSAGQARLLPDPEGDAADRDAACRRQRQNNAAAKQFVNWLYTPAAQTIWAQNGYRSVRAERREELPRRLPAAAAALQDQVRRRLGQGEHAVLRPDERHRGEDRAGPGAVHWLTSPHGCRGRGVAPSALRRSAAGSRSAI